MTAYEKQVRKIEYGGVFWIRKNESREFGGWFVCFVFFRFGLVF